MSNVTYDGKYIVPVQDVSINTSKVRAGDNSVINTLYSININGTLIAHKGSPTTSGTFGNLDDTYCEDLTHVTDKTEEQKLINRAQSDPKPLYYRPAFLREQLDIYLQENDLEYAAEMDPDDFTRWVFPHLFHSRIPRYEAIAKPHGYTVTSQEVSNVRDESDFLQLLETVIARTQ